MDLYAEHILDHSRSPRGKGALPAFDAEHTELNPSCGDTIHLQLSVADGVITACAWEGEGCAISQAGMSILWENLVSMRVEDIAVMTPKQILAELGVPVGPRRLKCALLALHTVQNALRLHFKQPVLSWAETLETI